MKKRFHFSLWLGSIFVFLLIVIAVAGPYMAPYELEYQAKMRHEVVNGKQVMVSPPLPPSGEHLLGTDKWGYDLLTLLLHGAPYTVFITLAIAFIRVLLGTWIGLYIGIQDKEQRWWMAIENAWSYMPVFIPVYFLLRGINVNSELPTFTLVLLFIGLVSVLGTPSVASSVRQRPSKLRNHNTFWLPLH